MKFEFKLLIRNKKYLNSLLLFSLLLGGNVFIQTISIINGKAAEISNYLFIVGINVSFFVFLIGFGQYYLLTECLFFDKLITIPIDLREYLKSKLYFSFLLFFIYFFICCLPLLSSKINLFFIFSSFIFQTGTTIFLNLYRGTLHNKRVDLTYRRLHHNEGTTISFFAIDLLIPLNAFIPFIAYFFGGNLGIVIIALLGIISLLLYKKWIQSITINLIKKKYTMSHGYRIY